MAQEPMSKDELWRIYVEKNPHWLTSGAVMTPDGIRKFFDQTFDLGHKLGLANGKAMAQQEGGDSLYERIFGRKF